MKFLGSFWEDFWEDIFWRIFWEKFFGRNFFGRNFMEGIFWEELFGRNSLRGILWEECSCFKSCLMKLNHLSFVKWFSTQFTFTARYFHSFFTLAFLGCLAVININCPTQVSTRMESKSVFWNTLNIYWKVASRSTSRLVVHQSIFRMFV